MSKCKTILCLKASTCIFQHQAEPDQQDLLTDAFLNYMVNAFLSLCDSLKMAADNTNLQPSVFA